MNTTMKILGFVLLLCTTLSAEAASVRKAKMLNEHGLRAEAKRELVDVLFSAAGGNEKAEAYYLLGSIAFSEKRITTALNTWNSLVEEYPGSKHAALVKDKASELAEIVGESTDEAINNAVAQSYLRHAEFWSEDKDSVFRIDSSWISNVESAIKWYDKVIAEFPKSPAAERAYRGKLRTLLGWKESGRYGDAHGVKGNFNKYMPLLLEVFSSFEADYPKAGSLQAFRYQIAQAYWANKDWGRTRDWLNVIITIAGDSGGFYKDLAQRRLRKVEH